MSHILIVNAGKSYTHSKGELNKLLATFAQTELTELGHQVKLTNIDEGYDITDEIAKYEWADTIIYQQPGWWMGGPWILKKYIDEIFTEGHGKLYQSDGRSRNDALQKYGSGGLMQGKHYMISATWNAPQEAFDEPDQFFEGKGVDAVYLPLHKANQFLGLEPIPTFLCVDVMKAPQIEQDLVRYKAHLKQCFS